MIIRIIRNYKKNRYFSFKFFFKFLSCHLFLIYIEKISSNVFFNISQLFNKGELLNI